jgi:hypothetical protein
MQTTKRENALVPQLMSVVDALQLRLPAISIFHNIAYWMRCNLIQIITDKKAVL